MNFPGFFCRRKRGFSSLFRDDLRDIRRDPGVKDASVFLFFTGFDAAFDLVLDPDRAQRMRLGGVDFHFVMEDRGVGLQHIDVAPDAGNARFEDRLL